MSDGVARPCLTSPLPFEGQWSVRASPDLNGVHRTSSHSPRLSPQEAPDHELDGPDGDGQEKRRDYGAYGTGLPRPRRDLPQCILLDLQARQCLVQMVHLEQAAAVQLVVQFYGGRFKAGR